jgi:hypothetical protein
MELKTPNGKGRVGDNQIEWLSQLEKLGYKTMVSNDYHHLIIEVSEYLDHRKYICGQCIKQFTTKENRERHNRKFH